MKIQNPNYEQNGYIIGRNAVTEALRAETPVNQIFVTSESGSLMPICRQARKLGIPVKLTDSRRLDAMTGNGNHQGICAEAACATYCTVEDILRISAEKGSAPFLILCDGIEDPHNLGAILRTAEAAGADGVILPKRRSASLTQTVYKTSAGAASWIPVARVSNLATEMIALKKQGIWFYGADMQGAAATATDLRGAIGLVIGSEGFGLSEPVKAQCDAIVSLPMFGKVNSLNASVAAGILMYEAVRQRTSIN
ncbi:MAG: 23S rRNA (guanosine(2251)-2'-O)-methyltransferase RlmB [Oscillospiraceae bacterium]|nr:23S rRNA (guanosine(2251)-2'-O)-methyltransferase RlmB [Oscillospiraceae bacterium]